MLDAGEDYLKARMPVDSRTRQPAGVLHGGHSSQVWEVRISDERDRLVCISRVTMAVLATPMRY